MNRKLTRLWATKTKDDEWWSSFITPPLAIAINYFVVDFKWLTPNKITLLSFITAIISVLFIIPGGNQNFIIAAILINLSHVFDCMDGQMARYRKATSIAGGFYDKLTDEIQVALWFSAVGYAAYSQNQQVLPLILALIGVIAYTFKSYVKYVSFYTLVGNNNYLSELTKQEHVVKTQDVAGLDFGLRANLRWFIREQRKIINVNEGVFIFMLSFALILDSQSINSLNIMLWIFAISQVSLALIRTWFKCREIASIDNQQHLDKSLKQ